MKTKLHRGTTIIIQQGFTQLETEECFFLSPGFCIFAFSYGITSSPSTKTLWRTIPSFKGMVQLPVGQAISFPVKGSSVPSTWIKVNRYFVSLRWAISVV